MDQQVNIFSEPKREQRGEV